MSPRILITGGTGFLGSFVTAALQKGGHNTVFSLSHNDCDLLEKTSVEKMLDDTKPDIIIHLAARVGGIGANKKFPADFARENIIMDTNILHAAALRRVAKVVCVGSVCAYPSDAPIPFREESIWDGYPEKTNAPYGVAKRMLLTLGKAYSDQYGLNSIHLIPANLYGPGDHFEAETSHVIPALIKKFSDAVNAGQQVVTLWGDGTPTRDFLYVEDAAGAIVRAMESYDGEEPMNLGGTGEISILDLARLIARLTGYYGEILWDASRPNGQSRRVVDSARAHATIGFTPVTSLDEGLKKTIAWYRGHSRA